MPHSSPQKTRVLHVLTSTAGGLGQSVLTLLNKLDRQRYELLVVFGPGYPLDDVFLSGEVPARLVRFARGLKLINLLGFYDVYRLIRHAPFDVIHIHGGNEAGVLGRIAAKLAGGRNIIYSLHGTPTVDRSAWLVRKSIALLDRLLDRVTDHYIAVSAFIGNRYLHHGIGLGRMSVIHHGIEWQSAQDVARRRGELLQTLGLPIDAVLVGSVGLIEPRKGFDYLIRAIPQIRAQHPQAIFLIVGDGPQKAALERLSDELKIGEGLKFLGWRDDAKQLIELFDLMCHPALSEPLGLVLLEAMAHAVPVVASAVQGIPEVVDDGQTGVLVPAEDSEALAIALIELLNQPDRMQQLGRLGYQRLTEHFSVAHMVAQYEAVYQALASR